MKRRLGLSIVALGLMIIHPGAAPGEQKGLPPGKYARWLGDEVIYLITKDERKAFISLKSDAEREAFIRTFWARLDPFPLTPENEFREEHYRRLAAAGDKYGIHTDRGRIFILLGPPDDTDAEPTGKYVFPCEVWTYFNLNVPGVPNSLRLIFFKQWGIGDYRLYSPLFDGLEYLVPQREYDFKGDPRLNRAIRQSLGPEFLRATESVSPGANQLQSEKILSTLRDPETIIELRRREKPVVSTFVSYEKFPVDLVDATVADGRGNCFYDACLQISPGDMTFEKSGDKFYGREDVYITITDSEGGVVSRFNEQLPIAVSENEMEERKGFALTYGFSGIFLPGEYGLRILMRDFVSNRIGEKEVKILLPPAGPASGIILAAGRESLAGSAGPSGAFAAKKPFVFGSLRLRPRATRAFARTEKIFFYMELYPRQGASEDIALTYSIRDPRGRVFKSETERRTIASGTAMVPVERVFSTGGLLDGEYELVVGISGPSMPGPVETRADFAVTDADPSPGEFAFESQSSPTPAEISNSLGLQALFRKKTAQAETYFKMALDFSPEDIPAKINLAKCRVLEDDPDAALHLLEPIVAEGFESGEVCVLLGNIYYGKKDILSAVRSLERAADLNVESVEILNFLASLYLEQGNKEKSSETFRKSLKIKEDQPAVKAVLKRIEG
jgi:GWxTD domain-containing protein